MKAWDFFCGAGGLTRGLTVAGIEVVAGIDNNHLCRETYEYNNSGSSFINADIRRLSIRDLDLRVKKTGHSDTLLAGCAPCQPFSPLRKGVKSRSEVGLLAEFGRLVETVLPGYVLVENVPGIIRRSAGTFNRFLRMFESNGYRWVSDVLNAKHYGVPQNRRRLVVLASRHHKPVLPVPSCGRGLRKYVTVRDAISRFPSIEAGGYSRDVPNHVAASVVPLNLMRLQATPHDGGDRRSWPEDLILECHKGGHKGHSDVYGRMSWDHPAPTLTGRCNSISNGRYGHPEQNRAISLREAAAIQTFPDDYRFFGTMGGIAQQIGNAVPVKFAEYLGQQLLQLR